MVRGTEGGGVRLWSADDILKVPMPDANTQTAERHCYEVALDMLFLIDKGWPCSEQIMRDFVARLMEGVHDRYSSKPT